MTARDFVTLEYTWVHDGSQQSGLMLLGSGSGSGGRITMHNVVPGYDPYQAVEATYGQGA